MCRCGCRRCGGSMNSSSRATYRWSRMGWCRTCRSGSCSGRLSAFLILIHRYIRRGTHRLLSRHSSACWHSRCSTWFNVSRQRLSTSCI
uniref:Uncharacterized protein n=1 Tax=Parascaris univalens TaxID=6257 RepID=A0A915BE42_PARUN